MKFSIIVCCFLLSGCAVGPDYQPPANPLSRVWRNVPDATAPSEQWWKSFNDPVLDKLESDALRANLDLESAAARVYQSRATLGGIDAALLPSAEVDGAVAREQQSLNSGLGQLSRYIKSFPRLVDYSQLNLAASWDLDLAGSVRRQREAGGAQLVAAVANYDAARLTISAEIADAYLSFRGAQDQLKAARLLSTLLLQQRDIMEVRVRVKDDSVTSLNHAAAIAADASAQVPALEAAIELQRNRIAVLSGRDPSVLSAELLTDAELPAAQDPAAGRPADLLRNRPDVRAAEAQLIISNAAIGVAIAEYYPQVSLTGLLGQYSNNFASFTSSKSSLAEGAAGLRWRLFDFARIGADVDAARGREREARAAYRQAVLLAAESVETSFSQLFAAKRTLANLTSEHQALSAIVDSVQRAVIAGQASRDELLGAQATLARFNIAFYAARRDVARAVVACERSLGVGIDTPLTEKIANAAPTTFVRTKRGSHD